MRGASAHEPKLSLNPDEPELSPDPDEPELSPDPLDEPELSPDPDEPELPPDPLDPDKQLVWQYNLTGQSRGGDKVSQGGRECFANPKLTHCLPLRSTATAPRPWTPRLCDRAQPSPGSSKRKWLSGIKLWYV